MSGVQIIIRNPPSGDLVELGNQFIYRGGWEVIQKAEEGAVGTSTARCRRPSIAMGSGLGASASTATPSPPKKHHTGLIAPMSASCF